MSGRLCPSCEREIVPELYNLDGMGAAVDLAGEDFPDAEDTDFAREEVSATIRLSCSCSYHDVDVEGSVSAFDFMPDEWVYKPEAADD